MNCSDRNMHGIFACLCRRDTSGDQSLREFNAAGSNIQQRYLLQRVQSFARRDGISRAAFRENKFRRHQIEFATSVPEEVSALLMAGLDNVPARAGCQVAMTDVSM